MISNNYIPEKINEYNAYLDGTKMIGVAASVTLPEVNMKTSTVSGVGVNGELDSPTIGQFESMEQEIQFNTLYSSAMDMLSPLSTVNLTLRASQQVYDKQGGYQALKEMASRQTAFARETLERKFKNRKIEYDEAVMMRLIKRMGYKVVTEFYQAIADGALDVNDIIDRYLELQKRENDIREEVQYRSAEEYNLQPQTPEDGSVKEDVLVIDQNLKGIDFKLAKCCNPIYGDDVFGFVSVTGGIKIHRCDCPNAAELHARFGYRIVKARWAGKGEGTQYPITLRVVGHDDIGIVTNITSIISKETGITLRSIGINSNDGLFSGTLTVMVGDTGRLEALIKKLRTVKGVKQVERN